MPAAFGFRVGGFVGGHEEKYLVVQFSIWAILPGVFLRPRS